MSALVVTIATAWGSKYGGINSFNYDLAVALAHQLSPSKSKVICAVPLATQEEIKDALVNGVELIVMKSSTDQIAFPPESAYHLTAKIRPERPHWWIGHDVITGPAALKAKELSGGRCGIVHHMNYEAYLPFHSSAPREKLKCQRDTLLGADIVFAVGPKLADSAREKIRGKSHTKVVELTPGLAPVDGLETPKRFSAITFGRLDPANDRVKQARLAVAAFGRARSLPGDPLGNDASLTVIGLSEADEDEERRELMAILDRESERAVPLHGWPFLEDRAALLDHLRQHSVCLMLSLHEGFGLVGWEAIAAEVPLIVSTNTGLYEAVSKYLGGVGRGCFHPVSVRGTASGDSYRPEDLEEVARALIDVKKHESASKGDARVLKGLLKLACTWDHTALDIAKACELPVSNDVPQASLAKWTPELLIEALKKGSDVVEEASRRKEYFSHIWQRIKPPSEITKRLVIFGGVSQSLCTTDAAGSFATWLEENNGAHLYMCYEADEAAAARALRLDEKNLETQSGLPSKALERMNKKQQIVEGFSSLLEGILGKQAEPLNRVHIIRITKPLSTYVIIADSELYLTPLFEKRASDSLSFTLAGKPSLVQEVISSVLYHLEIVEADDRDINTLAVDLRNAFIEQERR